MKKEVVLLIFIISLLFLVSCAPVKEEIDTNSVEPVVMESEDEIKVTKDGVKYIIDPKKIRSGGPPKDGIPPIDDPIYNPIGEIDWIEDNELILAIEYKGVKRVYPLQIMVWHEIVNDFIDGERVLITYCPLCGSGIAFKPVIEVDGEKKAVEFGTSGKLYNSNLNMYMFKYKCLF